MLQALGLQSWSCQCGQCARWPALRQVGPATSSSALTSIALLTMLCHAGLAGDMLRPCDAGPFASLIFADSICSLATAAPLVYFTKPWRFANWRLVVTLLAFQVTLTLSLHTTQAQVLHAPSKMTRLHCSPRGPHDCPLQLKCT